MFKFFPLRWWRLDRLWKFCFFRLLIMSVVATEHSLWWIWSVRWLAAHKTNCEIGYSPELFSNNKWQLACITDRLHCGLVTTHTTVKQSFHFSEFGHDWQSLLLLHNLRVQDVFSVKVMTAQLKQGIAWPVELAVNAWIWYKTDQSVFTNQPYNIRLTNNTFTWLWWWLLLRLSKRQPPSPTTVLFQDYPQPDNHTTQ